MARAARINLENTLYFIRVESLSSKSFLQSDQQKMDFVTQLGKVCSQFDWQCWGFCLSNYQSELLIWTRQANLSKGMRELNGLTTQAYNRQFNQRGPVLKSRFLSYLVDFEDENLMVHLYRYFGFQAMNLSPSKQPLKWKWSHLPALVGKAWVPNWITLETPKQLFKLHSGHSKVQFINNIIELEGIALPRVKRQQFLGEEQFIEKMFEKIERQNMKNKQQDFYRITKLKQMILSGEQQQLPRNHLIKQLYQSNNYSMKEIGDEMGLNYSTISRIINQKM